MDLLNPSQETESRRDALSSAFDAVDAPVSAPAVDEPQQETASQAEQRARDEQGRFASKQAEAEPVIQAAPITPEEKPLARPTHWKKDYLPMWDKLATGAPLTPDEAKKLAAYSNQRESEFASGVSTYRAEAERAKELQEAIAPFLPELQRSNIEPTQWIKSLGQAHETLVKGSPEQKLQMFARLAADYRVDLGAFTGSSNPMNAQLMQQIQSLSGQVNTFTNWQKQEEQRQAEQVLAKFNDAEKFPHYEAVRGTMAELLLSGLAKDPEAAYAKAVRINDEVWSAEQERQVQAKAAQDASLKAAAVAKAKSNVISVKSATPSGTQGSGAKDRRSLLAESFESVGEGRL